MARIRSIKPEFPLSETTGRLSREARLLFIQLWTIVDDEGRTRAASRMLASLLYPYDDDARALIEEWLGELEQEKCIVRYEVDGAVYLEITNWLKHQKIDHPSKSRLPSPREGSRILVPDLGPRTKDQDLGSEDSVHSLRECSSEKSKIESLEPSDWPVDYRERFWSAYPRKTAKKPSLEALDRIRKRGKVKFLDLMAGVARIPIGDPQFIPHAKTWLSQERWQDEASRGPPHAEKTTFQDLMAFGDGRNGTGASEYPGTDEGGDLELLPVYPGEPSYGGRH